MRTLEAEKTVESAILFGSRAKGKAKAGSDVDIALSGKQLTRMDIVSLSMKLNEESCLPYSFDLVDRAAIDNPELADHIDRVGIVLFTRYT